MRQIFLLGILLFSVSAFCTDTKLVVKGESGLSGTAVLTNKILEDGSKYVRLTMELKNSSGQKVTVMQESTYSKNGRPIRKLQVTNLSAASTKQSVVVTFDDTGAHVKVDAGGRTAKEDVKLPGSKSILAKPEFWFIRDTPNPGDVTSYSRFDVQSQTWIDTKSIYHGKREIVIGGKKVMAHLMEYEGAKAYVDEKGNPFRIETGGTVMERTG